MNSFPAGATGDVLRTGIHGHDIRIAALPPMGKALFRARGNPAWVAEQVWQRAAVKLPLEPNTSISGLVTALWTGPSTWLLLTELASLPALRQTLESLNPEITCLAADVSDARCGFVVSGPGARNLLGKLCALDLHDSVFAPGQCAQSLLARIPVLVYRAAAGCEFHLYVDRSFSAYAWDWLSDAASEFLGRSTG